MRDRGNAIPEAVRYLLEQQTLVRAPLRQPLGVETVLNSEVTVPITGLPIFIAAHNTRAAGKEIASYVCTGVNDQDTIRQALQDLQLTAFSGIGGFGWLIFLDGTYIFDDSLLLDNAAPARLLLQGDGKPRFQLNYNTGGTDSTNALFNIQGGGVYSVDLDLRFYNIWFDGDDHSNGRCFYEWTLTAKPIIHVTKCLFTRFDKNIWWSERGASRYFHENLIQDCDCSAGQFQFDSFSSGWSHIFCNTWANCSGDMVTGSFFALSSGGAMIHDNIISSGTGTPALTKGPLDGVYYHNNLVDGVISGGAGGGSTTVAYTGDITPTTFAADQHNYNPTGLGAATVLRLSSNASRNLTGIDGESDGRILVLLNVGANPIVLKDEDANSTANHRFALPADITLAPDESATLQYDSTSSRWRLIARGH